MKKQANVALAVNRFKRGSRRKHPLSSFSDEEEGHDDHDDDHDLMFHEATADLMEEDVKDD
jgi:hypothetical protein